MKKIFFFLLIIAEGFYAQNIGIGTTRPHPKAKLEISDSTRVFLPPRMTTFQRDTMTNVPMGGIIFNVTTRCLEYWNGRRWISLCSSSCMDLPVPEVNVDVINICQGDAITLSVTDLGYTYVWLTPQGQQIIGTTITINSVTPSDTGVYVVYAYDSLTHCSSQDTAIQVRFNFSVPCSSPDSWAALPSPPTNMSVRENHVAIALNGKIYLGLGLRDSRIFLKDWWEYDPCRQTWKRLTDFPGAPRRLAFVFAINNFIYVGGGDGTGGFYDDAYRYDPTSNTWQSIASLPSPRSGAPGTSDETYGYVVCGENTNTFLSEILRYDPSTNSWNILTNYPAGGKRIPFTFFINGKLYVGTGSSSTNPFTNDFYAYDIATNTWTPRANFPVNIYDGWGISNPNTEEGYVLGAHISPLSCTDIYYKYTPSSNTWTPIATFPGGDRNNLIGDFVYGKIYCGLGHSCPNEPLDWWVYCP